MVDVLKECRYTQAGNGGFDYRIADILLNMMEHAPVPFVVRGHDLKMVACNLAFYKMLGLSKKDTGLLSCPDDLISVIGDSAGYHTPSDISYMEDQYEKELVRKDGKKIYVRKLIRTIHDNDGNPYYFAFFIDVTGQRLTEADLKDNEEKYRSIIKQMTDGLLLADRNGTIVENNASMDRICGMDAGDYLGKTVWDFSFGLAPESIRNPALYGRLKSIMGEVCSSGCCEDSMIKEINIVRPDGTARSIQSTFFPVKTTKGTMVGSMARDVTDQKRAEHLSDALYTINLMINSTLDTDEIIKRVLAEASKAIGSDHSGMVEITRDRLVLKHIYRCTGEFTEKVLTESEITIIKRILSVNEPVVAYGPDRDLFSCGDIMKKYDVKLLFTSPLVIKGEVIGILLFTYFSYTGSTHDTSIDFINKLSLSVSLAIENARLYEDRKNAIMINDSLNRLTLAINSTLSFDEIMKKVVMEATESTGADICTVSIREGDQWVIRYLHGLSDDFLGLTLDDAEARSSMLAIETKKPVVVNIPHQENNISNRAIFDVGVKSHILVPLIYKGEAMGIIGFFNRDARPFKETQIEFADRLSLPVSMAIYNARLFENLQRELAERKRTESLLKKAKDQTELYVDLMCHDINNYNQVAMGYLELISLMGGVDDVVEDLISRPIETLKVSSQLINNVRKIQQLDSGNIGHETIDLGRLIDGVKSEYDFVPGRDITINYDRPEGFIIAADGLLRDVIANLISNSIKHSHDSVTINLSLDRADIEGTEYYVIQVEDNGPGITDGIKGLIFDRSYRADTGTRGMGLGLYLVKALIEAMNGKVWVENRVKDDHTKGCRFIVMLPGSTPS